MNRPLLGWVILWLGLLLTVVSGRHASGQFINGDELAIIFGGAPVPKNGNGWCVATCDCAASCSYYNQTNSCKMCAPPQGGTTQYSCCNNKNLGYKYNCVNTNNTANCGALTATAANNPPFGGGGPVGPCQDAFANWICVTPTGGEPACSTYQTIDQTKSNACPQ